MQPTPTPAPGTTGPNSANHNQRRRLPNWLSLALRTFLMLAFPVVLVLTSVRLVATEAFLRFEYNRPGFPADPYGLTTDERLEYGPHGVRYILQNHDISYLADLEYDGAPLFRAKELQHMEDVQTVTRAAFTIHTILLPLYLGVLIALGWRSQTRWALRQGLVAGGIFTLAAILTLVMLVLISWDVFFDGFHGMFFEGNSWRFYTSDSLIRLYPEQFWFDAAMVIGGLTIGGAVVAIGGVAWWERKNGATVDPVDSPAES